ncbi:MAG: alcohol dehydrogenase [Chloroflexi bacterium HGW-Chloroflexi-1]|nr:MAG: alcohol dehydrogenase [Chloroflexi bacterium HGW-Chloroflexi-1]
MSDKLELYRQGTRPLEGTNRLWPLYGAGLENFGRDGQPIEAPLPQYGPDQLLVRHDACGLCFSDIKVIKQGQDHPRIFRDIKADPVVLGHEVSMTVVGVGEQLRDQYRVGDRFIIQADIYKDGVNYAYGYMIQGGLSGYGVIDQRILDGDDGNYLIPVQPATGYAESALTEPWACVTAAYELKYRTGLLAGGATWIVGTAAAAGREYTISAGFDAASHPARLMLTQAPPAFEAWLRERAAALGIAVIAVDDPSAAPAPADDIVLLAPDADLIEAVSPHLADHGICAIIADAALGRKVSVDVGRVHYNRWAYVGGAGPDVARAYSDVPVRSTLKPGGVTWFVGAGGPMGRMHVQRAIQVAGGPAVMVCTDVSDLRLDDLRTSFAAEAAVKGIELICLNPTDRETCGAGMARFREPGFDDIVVLAPIAAVIADAATWLAPRGVMNVFAGVARGTLAQIDLSDAFLKGARCIGHSASSIDDLRFMLTQAESGTLSPNRSVAAIGSLSAARAGLQAVLDTAFPGKVVIFPHIEELPLTALPELREKLPTVYARLKDGREWTVEAEAEFLRLMLP